MGRLVSILLLAAVGCFGQVSQNTVYFQAATATVTTGTIAIPNYDNIGQGFHIVGVIPHDITAGSCSGAGGWSGAVRLEGSYDRNNWAQLSIAVTASITLNVPSTASAEGSFPYLRINYLTGNFGQCSIDIWYSGNLYSVPISLPDLTGFSLNASVNSEEILASCTKARAAIYSLQLINDAAANGFAFKVKSGAACNVGAAISEELDLPAAFPVNGQFILPLGSNIVPYFKAPQSDTGVSCFTMTATNATAWHVKVNYRCE